MDYEKKMKKMTREEAIEKVRKMSLPKETVEILEALAPELRESEDERIRKALIEVFKEKLERGFEWVEYGIPNRSVLSWLEKQKEQKPNIELIQKSWYMEGYHDRKFNNEPKWIIKTGEGGPRYEENPKYGQHIEQKSSEWSEKYIAGIFEKVGLAKIVREQGNDALTNAVQSAMIELSKSAEWNEEDEEMLNSCISSIEEAKENRYAYKETDGDTSYDHEIAWLKSLPLSLKKRNEDVDKLCSNEWSEEDEKALERAIDCVRSWEIDYCDGDNRTSERLKSLRPQPKQEWSKKDEMMLNDLCEELHDLKCGNYRCYVKDIYNEWIAWLHYLPERFNLQPKQEWDTHDKAIVNCIVCCLDGQFVPDAARKQSLEWFNKHRRDFLNCPSWKPSDEQMRALWDAYKGGKEQESLRELIEQLKKL